VRITAATSVVLASAILCSGQEYLTGPSATEPPMLRKEVVLALDAVEPLKDLDCTVTADKVSLGFDLKFHTGYTLSIPAQELATPRNSLSIIFRITNLEQVNPPQYFMQQFRVPHIDENVRAEVVVSGALDLGEGSYRVDWTVHDASDHFCSATWDTVASLSGKDKSIAVALPAGEIHPAQSNLFLEEPPVPKSEPQLLSVKVLVNFAPQDAGTFTLQAADTEALVGILRNIARNQHIGRLSVTAFNLQEQRVLFRQEDAEQIDFPALGEALKSINLAKVDVSQLARKNGEPEFLAKLVQSETESATATDALVFAGPKAFLPGNIPADEMKGIGTLSYPVFYMNYNRNPQNAPWKDSISRLVKFFRGYEFTITGPRDLWNAVSEMVSRTRASKSLPH